MNSSDPVFKSVGQALYIAYVMEITPPATKGATQLLIEDLMKERYGEAPIPKSERSVNMGTLTPLEFRGQCSMIRAAVEHHLSGAERDAIHARFGHQMRRSEGVRKLRDYFASLCTTNNRDAIHALIWAIYVPGARQREGETPQAWNVRRRKREQDWSLRGIGKEYACSKSTLHRDQKMLRNLTHSLEMLGQAKLEEMFVKDGLVVNPIYL